MLRLAYIAVGATLFTLLIAPLAICISAFDRTGHRPHRLYITWCRWVTRLVGMRVRVEGLDRLTPGHPYIFVANHQSLVDIPATIGFLPFQIRMVAKKELFRIPFFGWALAAGGYIALDRENVHRAADAIDRARTRLRNGDICLMVYPEGTRSPDGRVQRFKRGAFRLAFECGVPVVPIAIAGTREIVSKHSLRFRPGSVVVRVGEPLMAPQNDASAITWYRDRAREAICVALGQDPAATPAPK